jgi:hypothetical protein
VGVGLPSVLSFGGAIKLTRYFGAGVNVGVIPKIKVSLYGEAELSYQEYDAYGRLFPFGGMFFVGAGVGYATIKGSFKSSYDVRPYQAIAPTLPDTLAVESIATVRTLVLTPQIGLQHTFGSGFTLGIDVGLQVPLAPSDHFDTQLPRTCRPGHRQMLKPGDRKVQDTLRVSATLLTVRPSLRAGWITSAGSARGNGERADAACRARWGCLLLAHQLRWGTGFSRCSLSMVLSIACERTHGISPQHHGPHSGRRPRYRQHVPTLDRRASVALGVPRRARSDHGPGDPDEQVGSGGGRGWPPLLAAGPSGIRGPLDGGASR